MLSIYLEERKLNINSDCLWMVKLWVILLLLFRNVSLMFRFSTLSIKRMLLYDYKRNAFIVIRNLSKKQLIQMCVYIYICLLFLSYDCHFCVLSTVSLLSAFEWGIKQQSTVNPLNPSFVKGDVSIHLHHIYSKLSIFSHNLLLPGLLSPSGQ